MKFLRTLLIIIVIVAVIVGILTMIAPTSFSSQRSIVINTPRDVVYKNISTFENLHTWGPWDRKDSNMTHSIDGTDGTVGATWKWEGNKDVGKGEQTFTKIDAGKEVDMDIHFIEPFEGHAQSVLLLDDTTGGTKATWQFHGGMPRPFNIMGLFMNMDKGVGKDFEQGLRNLKELSESGATPSTSAMAAYKISEMDMPMKTFVGKRETVSFADIGKFFAVNLPKIGDALKKTNVAPAGPPSGIFYTYDTVAMKTDMAAGFPVSDAKTSVKGWDLINVASGKALMVDYFGDYQKTMPVYRQLATYANQKNWKMKLAVEEYSNDPMVEKDTAKWETKIYYYVE